jgi:Reverse transcriptase (RNA-dependent DNA polymerase)
VEQLLQAGVHQHLVRVITDLLSHRTTTIYDRSINMGRGVPQGDPLSPLLFIIFLQPLSDILKESGAKGAVLPGGLSLLDLLYADDMVLMSESAEDLNYMLEISQKWADQEGLSFSTDKSKAMVLAGPSPPELPDITLYNKSLKWVHSFKYLGCPIYANNEKYSHLPFSAEPLNRKILPMASCIHHQGIHKLPLLHRARALVVLAEGIALHNAQVADLDCKAINAYINRGLKSITGTYSPTILRCDLGILPAELVTHRNCLYYLWHLSNQAWFREHLPALSHLYPIRRLTSITLQYEGLSTRETDRTTYQEWKSRVNKFIKAKATTFYDTSRHQSLALYPEHTYQFRYGGQSYVTNPNTADLAQIALELRQFRLPLARNLLRSWEECQCPLCGIDSGMNGLHLLQCPSIPAPFARERADIINRFRPGISLSNFASDVVACRGSHICPKKKHHPGIECIRQSLLLGSKIAGAARIAIRDLLRRDSSSDSCNPRPRLMGDITEGGLSAMLMAMLEQDLPSCQIGDSSSDSCNPRPRLMGDITEGGLSAMLMAMLEQDL